MNESSVGAGVDVILKPSYEAQKNPDEIFKSLIGISHFPIGFCKIPWEFSSRSKINDNGHLEIDRGVDLKLITVDAISR